MSPVVLISTSVGFYTHQHPEYHLSTSSLFKTSQSSEPKPNTTIRARVGGDYVERQKWRRSNGIKETCEACRHTSHQGCFFQWFFFGASVTLIRPDRRGERSENLSVGRWVDLYYNFWPTCWTQTFTFQMYNYVLGKGFHTKATTILKKEVEERKKRHMSLQKCEDLAWL